MQLCTQSTKAIYVEHNSHAPSLFHEEVQTAMCTSTNYHHVATACGRDERKLSSQTRFHFSTVCRVCLTDIPPRNIKYVAKQEHTYWNILKIDIWYSKSHSDLCITLSCTLQSMYIWDIHPLPWAAHEREASIAGRRWALALWGQSAQPLVGNAGGVWYYKDGSHLQAPGGWWWWWW